MARIYHTGRAAAGLIIGALLLGGCGTVKVPETIERPSLVIESEGTVTSYAVGVFDRDYYSLRGLQTMAQEEAAAYNTAHQTGTEPLVEVSRVEASENGSVVVAYRYDSGDIYRDYSKTPFFYGTVGQAEAQGYHFEEINQVLFDAKGDRSMVSSELTRDDLAKKHVALVEEPTYVYCPYKVAYISEGARIAADGSVDTTGAEIYPVIILMNK